MLTSEIAAKNLPTESHGEDFFREVMLAHGPMVLATCRRILLTDADSEDAFQATFLLFSRNARTIRQEQSVAAWIHQVATRVSLQMKAKRRRQSRHERGAAFMRKEQEDARVAWEDLRPLLDEELSKLPSTYRSALVLCYFEGNSREQAAAAMGVRPGAIKGLLERGREALRSKLLRRGVVVPAAVLAAMLANHSASAAVPASLSLATAQASAALWAGSSLPAGMVSTKAVILAASMKRAIQTTALKTVVIAAGTTVTILWTAHAFQHEVTPSAWASKVAPGVTSVVSPSTPARQQSPTQPPRLQIPFSNTKPSNQVVLKPQAAKLLANPAADVSTTNAEWVPISPTALVYGHTDDPNNHLRWGPLPAGLEGRQFTRFIMSNSVPAGRTPFNVLTDGIVILAVNNDFGGGGNSGGNWQPELTTATQLEQQGWEPFAESEERIFYVRFCHRGESYVYRTQKYHMPILVK